MQNKNKLLALLLAASTISLHANAIWPAMVIGGSILSSLFLISISIIIEGMLLKLCISTLSIKKSMLISLVGNSASALIGTCIMIPVMLIWHRAFDDIVGGTFALPNIIATYILMYAGSALIELFTIKLFFHYSIRQLIVPVLIGNSITYLLAAVYQFLFIRII